MFIYVYLIWIWKQSTLIKLRGQLRQLPIKKIHKNYSLLKSLGTRQIFPSGEKSVWLNMLAWYQRNPKHCLYLYNALAKFRENSDLQTKEKMLWLRLFKMTKWTFLHHQKGVVDQACWPLSPILVQRWSRNNKVWSRVSNWFIIGKYLIDK